MKKDTIKACIKSYPWASTVAMLLDCNWKVFYAFRLSENKARDKRLFHICNHPLRLRRHYYPDAQSITLDQPFPYVLKDILGMGDIAKIVKKCLSANYFAYFFSPPSLLLIKKETWHQLPDYLNFPNSFCLCPRHNLCVL